MADSDPSVSFADDEGFENFLQEPLSSDVPSSSESVASKDETKLWWMDKTKEKQEEKSHGASWLKKKSESLVIEEDVQEEKINAINVDFEPGNDPVNNFQKDVLNAADKKLQEVKTSEEEKFVEEQEENGSQYSDTFQPSSSSSTEKVAGLEGNNENILPLDQEKLRSTDTSDDGMSSKEQNKGKELCASQVMLTTSKTVKQSSLKVTTEDIDHLSDHNLHDEDVKDTHPKLDGSNIGLISEKEAVDSDRNSKSYADLDISPEKRMEEDITNLKQEYEKLLNEFLRYQQTSGKEQNENKMLKDENKTLKAQLEASEKDLHKKMLEQHLECEQEIAAIKKDNVTLLTRLEELELQKKGSKNEELLTADVTFLKDQIIHLQKEVQEQERLLQGYQQENERLYTELKNVQKSWKVTENKLKSQNSHLMGEVSRLREQIHIFERASSFKLQMSNSDKCTEESVLHFEDSAEENSPSFCNKQVKKLENLLEANKENNKEAKKIVSNKQIVEHDADMAKMKKLQSEVTMLQHKLKEVEQEMKDTIKFHAEEIKNFKVDNQKLTSELEGSRLKSQSFEAKNKNLYQQLQVVLEENKALDMLTQRKVSRMSKAIQTFNFVDKKRSDVVLENKELKIKMEKLETEKKDLETKSLIIKAETEKMLEIEQEEREHQLELLKKAHAADLQKIISDMAAQYSTSKVAELMNRLQSQEIILGQLNEKTKELKEMENRLDLQRIVNSDLEVEIRELKIELNKAKSQQTPEMRDVLALQEEIRELEKRQHRREEELQYLMLKLKNSDTKYLKHEVAQWQQKVIEKNEELEYFRSELNTILLFLEQLERQGITIPPLKSMGKDSTLTATREKSIKHPS